MTDVGNTCHDKCWRPLSSLMRSSQHGLNWRWQSAAKIINCLVCDTNRFWASSTVERQESESDHFESLTLFIQYLHCANTFHHLAIIVYNVTLPSTEQLSYSILYLAHRPWFLRNATWKQWFGIESSSGRETPASLNGQDQSWANAFRPEVQMLGRVPDGPARKNFENQVRASRVA